MLNRPEILEVKETPEKERYIKSSFPWRYIGKPFSQRSDYGTAFLLSLFSSIPLFTKATLNLIESIIDNKSYQVAKKNFLAAIGIPVFGSLISLLGAVLPQLSTSLLINRFLYPAPTTFHVNDLVPTNYHTVKDEVGPKQTPCENEAYFKLSRDAYLQSVKLPANRILPEVKGKDGIDIDTMDLPYSAENNSESTSVTHWRLCFNALASYYQKHIDTINQQQKKIKANTRLFNYPGISKPGSIHSFEDLVNAGIAEVYDLATKLKWTNSDLEKNLHLYGYCSGGSVAIQVAAYFKERHHLNLKLFIDRSYISFPDVIATVFNEQFGLPFTLGKKLFTTFLRASGDFHANAIEAIKTLDANVVNYINAGHKEQANNSEQTYLQMINQTLGIGYEEKKHADPLIPDGTALADGLEELKSKGINTEEILLSLKGDNLPHRIYSVNGNAGIHHASLDELFIDQGATSDPSSNINVAKLTEQKRTALDYYAGVVDEDEAQKAPCFKM